MSTNRPPDVVGEILELADKLARKLLPAVAKDLLEMDLTMPQLKIMVMLFINESARMSDIASGLGVTMATDTGLIDRLVERQYVVRESLPDDRRVVLCRLSGTGREVVGRIWNLLRNRSRELLEAMDTEHLEMFVEVLQAMLDTAEYAEQEDKIRRKESA